MSSNNNAFSILLFLFLFVGGFFIMIFVVDSCVNERLNSENKDSNSGESSYQSPLSDYQEETAKIKNCQYDNAEKKIDYFLEKYGFVKVSLYDTKTTADPQCEILFSLRVKRKKFDNYSGRTEIGDKVFQLNLILKKYSTDFDFYSAILYDLSNQKYEVVL